MKAAIIALFALFAVATCEPGVLAPALVAPAPVLHAAPVVHAAPVAVPVATSSSYKIRAPAAKVLATPVLAHGPIVAAAPAPVLLH